MEYQENLVEVDEVLEHLIEKDLKKIPEEIRNSIKEQKDKNYKWKYDESKELKDQKLDRKTVAILSYLNTEYLLDYEQKILMQKIHEMNEKDSVHKSNQKYNPEELFKKKNDDTKSENSMLIVVKKLKWYEKILNAFRNIFKN